MPGGPRPIKLKPKAKKMIAMAPAGKKRIAARNKARKAAGIRIRTVGKRA